MHIYIHIPFCLKKCAYCNFYSVTGLSQAEKYIGALFGEIDCLAKIYRGSNVRTIYLGGGTPSLLPGEYISDIYERLKTYFTIDRDCEFTIEANPEAVDAAKLEAYRKTGINRISIGVQSFSDRLLKYLGRVHTAERAEEALKIASEIFDNINIDLIYGLPRQTREGIKGDILRALSFSPRHISCYELTFEEGTPLYKDADKKGDDEGEYYNLIRNILHRAGYRHYEISNFALPGFECRHNLAYWSDESYLGFGPAAHSYDREKGTRWANKASLQDYIEGERIDFTEDAEEFDKIIMGLRKIDGMETSLIPESYRKAVFEMVEGGFLRQNGTKIAFTEKGVLLANRVLLELISHTHFALCKTPF